MLSQGTFLNVQLGSVFQELLLTHIVNSSSEFKTRLLINAGETLKIFSKTIRSGVLVLYLLPTETSVIDLQIDTLKSCNCSSLLVTSYLTWFYLHKPHLCKHKFVKC